MDRIYFDNASTTKVDKRVLREMDKIMKSKYGNASSQHLFGQESKRCLEDSRKIISKKINADKREIVFTSGGTEGNNFVLKGLYFQYPEKKHIITTKIEHDCVLNSCKWLEGQGVEVDYLDVDENGFVDLDELKNLIRDDTLVVSVIHGNNEIGTVQDLEKIGKICKEKNVFFHTDACQSFTKEKIDVRKFNLDFVTLNSHKIHGPKGVGAVYLRQGIKITPLLHGGGHENKFRSGTENIEGIIGFAKAVSISREKDIKKMEKLRDKIIKEILKIPKTKLNGDLDKRLCNNINISFGNIEGESIGGYLDVEGICISTGSACSSKSLEPSHVLKAIGRTDLEANTSIRISLSKFNTEKEVEIFIKNLNKIVERLRKISPVK